MDDSWQDDRMGEGVARKMIEGCVHSRGCTRVSPTCRGAPFPPPSSRGGIIALRGRDVKFKI